MKNLYCGYVRNELEPLLTNREVQPIFEVVSIKVVGRDENLKYTMVDGFYYIAPDISLEYIPDTYLDQQLYLNFGEVMYSFDQQKCIDFVNDRYQSFKERVDRYIRYLQKAQKCPITISEEQDGYKNGC